MQAPVSVFDRCFLEMDPLFSVFDTLCYDVSHRGSRHDKFKSVIQQLKTQGWAKAVQRWRYLAFPRSKNKKPVIDDRNWRIFVRFQWRLKHSRQQADIYLSNLRSGRSPTRLPSLSEDRRPLAYISFKRRRQPGTHRGTGIQAIKNPVARRKKRNTKAKVDAKPESMAVDPSTSLGDRYTNNHYWQINRSDESYADATPSHQEQLAIVDPISIDSQPYPLIFVQENDPEDREASFNHWNDVGYRQEMLVNIPTATNIKSPPLNSMMGLVPQPISSLSVSVYNGGLPISDAAHNMTAVHLPTTASHATLPVALNASLTNVSSMANHCKQDLDTSDNLHINWLSSTCDDPMALYYDVEEAEISAAYHNNSEQVLMIDRHKAPLPWYPPIWAQSRQEVCETFCWFRSYQGGVYYNRDIVKGYLLGGFSASRDRFEHDGRFIISHGGGKAACLHQRRGQTFATAENDQLAQDRSVRALLRTHKECRPVVLVIDDRYALFPFDLSAKEVRYAVLGFYTIAYAWAEFQPAQNEHGRVIRYKFAFRWCEGQGEPWWIPNTGILTRIAATSPKSTSSPRRQPVKLRERALPRINASALLPLYSTCLHCHNQSPQVYIQGWACLVPECPLFWTSPRTLQRLPDKLDYDPKFLQLTKPFVLNEALTSSLKPPIDTSTPNVDGIASYASTTRGWHCDRCGRLSCRYKWEKHECAHCSFSVNVSGDIRSPNTLRKLHVPVPFQDHFYSKASGVTFFRAGYFDLGRDHKIGSCQTFKLPHQRGFIHHIKAVYSDDQPEVDRVFTEYQQQALAGVLPFRRWPLRSHKCRGSLLTNYFSQNCGVPYQYVGGTANTLPWSKAPGAVVSARNLIQSRVSKALRQSVNFNEVLSAAYMERQRMSFHSDSEPGLGPLVAGLSLGSPALMHFRLLAKYEPLGEQRQIAMTFVLRHGDVLVMDGAKIQEYYEHTVVPSNFRIAATARWINNEHPSRP